MFGLWPIKDAVITGLGIVFSLPLLISYGWLPPLTVSVVYGLAAVRIDDVSIGSFLKYAARYFLFCPQEYQWKTDSSN